MALTKISTGVIAANTLATGNIADNSVDATKIASNSILTRHIDDDQITGDQLADNITIAGNLTITGNLTTNGSTVTNSSSNTTIEDALIELGTGTSGSPATDAGIVIERGTSDNVFIGWDESADKVMVGTGSFTGASSGNLTITAAPFVSGALTASGISYPTSDGSAGHYLKTDGSGTLSFGAVTTQVDNYTASGNGSTTAFDTGINPQDEVNTWVFIDGVYQQKSTYSYSGSTITFSTAPENGATIDVVTGTTSGMASSDTVLGIYEATTTDTAAYTTGISASNENNTWVFVGGVYQPKDSYTFSSGTLTFDANTPTGQKLSVVATKALTAGSVESSSLGANAVTSAKIASNAILSRHITNNSIVGADISATTGITAATFTGAVTGNVTGNVAGNLTGTILTAAQTNITSVGTLSALTVSGQLTAGGLAYPTSDGSADQVLKTDGSGTISFGTVSGTTLNNNTNNYVMTGTGSSNTLNGEANLTFDGSTLSVNGSALNFKAGVTNFTNSIMIGDSTTGTLNAAAGNTGLGVDVFAALTEGDNNTAIGYSTMTANTTGVNNTAVGQAALDANTTGINNVAIGWESLGANTDTSYNTAIGWRCLEDNIASDNTAIGAGALRNNTTGHSNVAVGKDALTTITAKHYNTAVGFEALKSEATSGSNTAVGGLAMMTSDGASNCTSVGKQSGYLHTTGDYCTYVGANCAYNNTTGGENTAIGYVALYSNTTGQENTIMGSKANYGGTTASGNTVMGYRAMYTGTTAYSNTVIGSDAGYSMTEGHRNTFIGINAGYGTTTGDRNICIGSNAQTSSGTDYRSIMISTYEGTGKGNGTFHISAGTGSGNGYQGNNSSAWATTSDRRIKKNIVDNTDGLDKIKQIQVKNFEYRTKDEITDWSGSDVDSVTIEKEGTQLGVIAQEIQEIFPDVVTERDNGCLSVDSDNITWYLVNAVKQQQTIIDDLKSRLETLEE